MKDSRRNCVIYTTSEKNSAKQHKLKLSLTLHISLSLSLPQSLPVALCLLHYYLLFIVILLVSLCVCHVESNILTYLLFYQCRDTLRQVKRRVGHFASVRKLEYCVIVCIFNSRLSLFVILYICNFTYIELVIT